MQMGNIHYTSLSIHRYAVCIHHITVYLIQAREP